MYRDTTNATRRLGCTRNTRGLTLAEALIVTLIILLLFGACATILLSGSDSWYTNSVRIELQQEVRKAMDWLVADLRKTGPSAIIDVPDNGTWYDTITYKVSEGVINGAILWSTDTIQFLLGGVNSDQLQRQQGAASRIIANNIQSVQFRRQSATPSIVEVALQAQKSTPKGRLITLSANFQVHMRN